MHPAARQKTLFLQPREKVLDDFNDRLARGLILASRARSGAIRQGVDVETLLSTADGQLTMGELATHGWAREGIAYGPYTRQSGLCFVFKLLDGDVQAQETTPSIVNEHLAIGGFSSTSPSDPITDGTAFIIYNNGANAGLIARNGTNGINQTALTDNYCVSSLKQIPLYLIISFHADGARYYIATLASARQLASAGYPTAQLVHFAAINRTTSPLYASIWQRHTLGKSTHVEGVDVVQASTWAGWYASAYLADSLIGSGTLGSTKTADVGGAWEVSGSPTLSATGFSASAGSYGLIGQLTSLPAQPMGACSLIVNTGSTPTSGYGMGVVFRSDTSGNNQWWVVFNVNGNTELHKKVSGADNLMQAFSQGLTDTNATHHISIFDNGSTIRVYLDNRALISYTDTAFASQTGVQLFVPNNTTYAVRYLEFHPRSMTIPVELRTLGDPALDWPATGSTSVYTDDFTGSASNLDGKTTTTGSGTWLNNGEAPAGSITLTGSGKAQRQNATAGSANAIYTVPWSVPNYADLTVDITVPGTGYGNGTIGWAGVIFYQDADNWIGVRTYVKDDQTNAAEYELEDRTNSVGPTVIQRVNFGTEIVHGGTFTMRMVCDGERVICYKNGEPVICFKRQYWYGYVPPLQITRVGIIGYGLDSGSSFDNFVARSF